MKIVYVITGLALGGAEKVVVDLADEMVLKGHEVKLLYLQGEVMVKPKLNNIEIVNLGLYSYNKVYSAFKIYHKILDSFKPDIVHAHMFHAIIFTRFVRLLKKLYKYKLVCTAHSCSFGGRKRKILYRLTHSLSDKMTNVSQEACDNFILNRVVPRKDIITMYNGIDLLKFNKRDVLSISHNGNCFFKDKITLLCVGRFNVAKDYPNLIYALAILKSKGIDFRMLIAGDGEMRNDIEELIMINNLSDNVFLLGNRQDVADLINFSDVYILSSQYEGLPTVLLEAMACESLIVTTDCGGVSEIIGDTGILVPSKNALALANGIEKALTLSDKDKIENNHKARKRIEDIFSLDVSVEKWLKLYQSL